MWILATVGVVATIAAGAWWWEKQLPAKLQQAAQEGDLEACLRYGEQLAALRWLGQGAPEEQAHCRRGQAARLWQKAEITRALTLQRQLVQSGIGDATEQQRDRDRLDQWQSELRDRALLLFRDGELEQAIATLAPLEQGHEQASSALSATLRETWNRNRLGYERLEQLVGQQRWWEALDSLNRLDHPWWQNRSEQQRRIIETAIERLRDSEQHQQHGASDPDVISGAELEAAVQKRLRSGEDPWDAFRIACEQLGGQLEEDGPESFCRRRRSDRP